jgi:amino acid adenylation domain-containing protein
MSGTPRPSRQLTPEQLSELVLSRKRQRDTQSAASGGERITRRGASEAPLSFAQQRLWLLDRLEPAGSAYNMASAAWLWGEVHVPMLGRALTAIARRHESLRTTFAERGGEPVQVITPPAPFPLPLVDLAGLPEAAREPEVRRLARDEAVRPFDLARGPLVRGALARLGPERHLLLFNMHHIISDGWSFGLLFGELSALYDAFAAGRPSPLPELPVQYADFAFWQRERLRGAALEKQVRYWRARLQGAPPSLELPADRVRPPVQTHRGRAADLVIPAGLAAALRELSRRADATLFMTLLAAFKILLHRWAGQDDVVVGAPSAGRQQVETEKLIGFFLNTLVLRTDLSGDPTFLALLGRVRGAVLGAYQYQEVPFERLLDELKVERRLSHSPLFQVLFNMITLPEIRLALRGLRLEPLALAAVPAKFDFTLYVDEHGAGDIECRLIYSADLFDAARMAALLDELHHLLVQIAAAPDTPIAALSLVPPAAAALLPDPARPLADWPWPGPIHQRLTLHAARAPERLMVTDEAEAWSYGELEARANQLAHRLRQAGLGREDVVAIYADRSAALVWALLATLKAGAAFLILDPGYPAARLADYVRIARPTAWLASSGAGEPPAAVATALVEVAPRLLLTLPPRSGAAAAERLCDGQPRTPPAVTCGPGDLACVGFTSGSTGRPKAVLGRHGSLAHFQPWWQERFELGEADRFAMLSALAHDPLQRDVLTPVWLGASLFVPPADRMGDPGWLAAWAAGNEVTVVNLTPAMLEVLVGDGTRPMPALRRAFVVGDLLRRSEVERLHQAAPRVVCVNLYGATETQRAIAITVVARRGEGPAGKESLPLGRGIPGVDLLVRNAAGGRAGIGELGEVYVRSRQLARGYLDDAELTARRFLPNPFRPAGADAEDRLYRSGDLGRHDPSGEVEFAGRADQQVKIRGFRIEPAEIEAALRRHPAVRECVVVARGEADKRLAAYLAPTAAAIPARQLRAFVGERLPDYMVPADYVWLDALPMAGGKLDRLALPAPAPAPEREEGGAAAPRTAFEELLAGIWQELLGDGRPIGVHDNFFDLGGHSLLATRVLSRLREALGVEVPLRALFEAPTVAGLAAAAAARLDGTRSAAPPLGPAPRGERARPPLSFPQQRLWILDQLEPGGFAYHITAAIRLHGDLATAALGRSLAEIVRRHEALRTVFPNREGEPWQRVLPAAGTRLPVADLAALPAAARDAEARRLAGADARRPFDLARGPLLRVALLRLAAHEHALLLAMHHIVSDGWSIGVFTRELTALYRCFAAGAPSPLPDLPLQYLDFALWQRRWLQGEVLAEQLGYWRRALAGAPPLLELPTDRPRPAAQSHRGGRRWLTLPRGPARRLAAVSRRLEVTPFMLLLAAFAAVLGRHGGQPELMVGTPIANRGHRELEGLIGFFANTLALRVDAGGDPTFAGLARRVRQVALGAYAHQDLPFERLVDELQPERSLDHTPVFQVMLVLQNAPPSDLELGRLTFSPLAVDEAKAPFDLTLSAIESEGELLARLEYASDLFDAATAERLLGHYGVLLAAALDQPEMRLSALPLLTAAERHQLWAAWNDTRAEFPAEATVDELIAASAGRTPEAVAVSAGGRELRYRELAERAGRLARELVRLGVGPEVRVGLCLERTPELVVAMLAVLQAGGAYVPLDPSHPAERLRWILEDAGAPVLIADQGSLAALPRLAAVIVDPGAGDRPGVARGGPGAFGTRRADPENLAYVIYTSGSTGRPKGVEVRHRGVVNYLASMARRPGLTAGDTVLALTTVSFDIAVTELLLPLAVGARVELIDRDTASDAERLAAAIDAAGVTVMQATPATWTLLLEGGWAGRLGLKALAGGEVLPAALADRLRARVGELWNVYGPTETTVWSTLHPVAAAARRVPIGRPLANTTVHLLGAGGEPAPVGVPGELCIGGAGLARGYRGRPDLTAERFVPDPFAAGGARLYRTGDLARRLPGGELEFLGRIDHQVKVRGFRIELGEIEATLAALPGVAQAAVVVRERQAGERFLAAFLVLAPAAAPDAMAAAVQDSLVLAPAAAPDAMAPAVQDAGQLRAGLLERLPDYMLPAAFVTLPALPLTPSGKVDRRALEGLPLAGAAGGMGALGESRRPVAPRNAAETLLAAIWSAVLEREAVGIEDNFFALGGDSILAIRVVAKARQAGLRCSPGDLFKHQTIAALAAAAAPAPLAEEPAGALPSAFQRRLLAAAAAALPRANEAVLVALPPGAGHAEAAALLAGLARRHPALRLRCARAARDSTWRLEVAEPDWRLEVAEPERSIALAHVELGGRAAGPALLALAEEARDVIDLAVRPWTAALFHRGGGAPDLLLFAVHRLAVDGPGWEPLLDEIEAFAGRLGPGGGPSGLAELADLADLAELADLAGLARPRQGAIAAELAEEETALVLAAAGAFGVEPEAILAAALVEAAAGWSGMPALDLEVELHRPGTRPAGRGTAAAAADEAADDAAEGAAGEAADAAAEVAAERAVDEAAKAEIVCASVLVTLRAERGSEPLATLKRVAGELRRRPAAGEGAAASGWPAPAVAVRWRGRTAAGRAGGRMVPLASRPTRRGRTFEVVAALAGGRLRLEVSYGADAHRPEAAWALAEAAAAALRALAERPEETRAAVLTPADFPAAGLNQQGLEDLLAQLALD